MLFTHSKCGRHLGCFHLWNEIYNVYNTNNLASFTWTCLNSLGYRSRSEMMGLRSNLIFNFWRKTNFPKTVTTIYIISNMLSAPVFPQPKKQSCSYYVYIEVWNTDSLVMYDVQSYMVPTFNAMVTATYHSAKIMSPKHTEQRYIFENPSIIYINICKLLFSIIIRLSSIFLSTTLIVRHKYWLQQRHLSWASSRWKESNNKIDRKLSPPPILIIHLKII